MRKRHWAVLVLMLVLAALVATAQSGASPARSAADPGVDVASKTITVGGWQIASGPNASFVATTNAVKALFALYNSKGGVNGWKINYVTPDDGGDPTRALQAVRNQVEGNQIFAVVWGPGSPENAQVLPYLAQTGVPYVPPGNSGDQYIGQNYKNIYPFIPPYSAMALYMADYAIKHLHAKKIALAYENDAVGQPVHDKFEPYITAHYKGVKVVSQVSYLASDTDLTAVGRTIAASKPDVVIDWGTAGATVKSKAATMANGVNVPWFAPYFLADPSVIKLDLNATDGIYFNYYLRPFYSADKYAVEYRAAMKQFQPGTAAGGLALNGWAGGAVFVQALKQITTKGKVPTRDALFAALNSFKNKQIGVIPGITYSANAKIGVSSSYLIRFKNRRFSTVAFPTALPVVK